MSKKFATTIAAQIQEFVIPGFPPVIPAQSLPHAFAGAGFARE